MSFKLLLIGNYPADNQRSMLQYEALVAKAAQELGWSVDSWHPAVRHGEGKNTLSGSGKLAGYFDKYVLAPREFRKKWAELRASNQLPDAVHIVDHSNAPYARLFPKAPVFVTCHDLMAIRRARGEFSHATSRPRITGRWQQNWILNALKNVKHPGFVSHASKEDFINLTGRADPENEWPVINPSPAQPVRRIDRETARSRLKAVGIEITEPFIYHHGGATWYKNRETVIKVFLQCRAKLPSLRLAFSGAHLSDSQKKLLRSEKALDAVVDCGTVSEAVLIALYNSASVFLFPSWCEGFGWPPVEAQACGCPVVASNAGSLKEVLEQSAALFDPDSIQEMSEAVTKLLNNPSHAQNFVNKGLQNAARFTFSRMQNEYMDWILSANRSSSITS